ncbi:MAG: DUF1599 domain-containing protein [Bacteroidia bacterium]|nr:DUF1599 domain-containing protein [Bacteroidia bacterium]MDW8159271.1 DUF1599 domain-containing protein [Bacteroidia bacterium]
MEKTEAQFRKVVEVARSIFELKAKAYGTAWVVLRMPSITDQLFIKAKRIRTLEETGINLVGESIEQEWIGILNYCVIAQILLDYYIKAQPLNWHPQAIPLEDLMSLYDKKIELAWQVVLQKNHDYGEAWREMRITSFTDLVLMKILRLKQLEDNRAPYNSEYVSIYIDIINYSTFALIQIQASNNN